MKPAAERTGNGLRFKMVVKGSPIAPDRVAAQFNQAGAEHYAANQPTKEPNNRRGRRAFGKRPRVEQRAEENGEEPGFKKLDFPAVTVPVLAEVNERHVEQPEDGHDHRVGIAGNDEAGQRETKPGGIAQKSVGMREPENGWQTIKSASDAQCGLDLREK